MNITSDYGCIGPFWWINSDTAGYEANIEFGTKGAFCGRICVHVRRFGCCGFWQENLKPPSFSIEICNSSGKVSK